MLEVQQHNRDRTAQLQSNSKASRDYGTQVDEKPTRTIGTMSEPIKTRNSGNEVQPQSSATQTSNLLQQQQHEEDEIDLEQSTSQQLRHDTRTNGYYPSHRSTSLDPRSKYMSSSSKVPHHKDYSSYEQHRLRHQPQYNDDPRSQYIIATDDYHPHSSSRIRHRTPSPTSLHGTPPPPAEYRSSSPYGRYRTPSPSDHHQHRLPPTQRSRSHSRSPSVKKHISTSTHQHSTVSPPSQHRSRLPQRSSSPPFSKHHVSSSPHRTPSPSQGYPSKLPSDRHSPPPKNYSRRTKDRPQMVSTETDTSLDGMKPSQHRDQQFESPPTREYGTATSDEKQHPYQTNHSNNLSTRPTDSDYQKLDSNQPKRPDHTKKTSYEDNYKSLRDNQPPSTRKNYRLRPVPNDTYTNNYEEIPSKLDESITSPFNRSFERPKEYTPKPLVGDRHRQISPTVAQRSDGEEQYHPTTQNDEIPNEKYIRELPSGGSVSIPSTKVIQPDTVSRSRGQTRTPTHQNHPDYNRKIPEFPLHHGQEEQDTSLTGHSPLLNFGTPHINHQSPLNEVAAPFKIRYIQDADDEFSTNNSTIRSSTLKRDDLRSRSNRILLLPVLNSSRTYVFEKQSLPGHRLRQSRTNGNFYLASSPTLRSLNTSFRVDDSEFDPLTQTDSDNLTGHGLRSQVA